MSDTQMSESLKNALGINGSQSQSADDVARNIDDAEFDEFKDTPRPDVKFELVMKPTSVPELDKSDAKVDYEYARSMNYQLLEMTTECLTRALEVAKETEHPRAFESFNSLAATARGLMQDLLGVQKIFKEITKGRSELDPPPVAPVNIQINNGDSGQSPLKGSVNIMQALQDAIDRGEITPMGKEVDDDIETVEVKDGNG